MPKEMIEEQPTLEGEPKSENEITEQPQNQEEVDVEGLVAELQKAGVNNPEQLQGKLTASKEAGQLANLLGQANSRIRDLEQQIMSIQQQQPQPNTYDYGGEEDGGVNIQEILRQTIREEVLRERQLTMQAQQFVNEKWRKIQTDPDYELVKDVWEAKCRNPEFSHAFQTGQVDPVEAYNQTVREYYRGVAKKSLDAIEVLQKGGKPAAPHVESEAISPGREPDTSDFEEKLKQYRERVKKEGRLGEDEAVDVLDAILSQ